MPDTIFKLTEDQNINFVYSIILIAFLSSSLYMHFRDKPATALKSAAIWLVAICVLIVGYSYRYDFKNIKDRLVGELSPSRPMNNTDGSISFRVSSDGHYHIKTQINRRDVEFMLDTGASDVIISKDIAKHIGINMEDLKYIKTYYTANGQVQGAPILLDNIQIGNHKINNVRASVNKAEMDISLMGMSFLEKLDGYEVRDGILTIWP